MSYQHLSHEEKHYIEVERSNGKEFSMPEQVVKNLECTTSLPSRITNERG